jgi:hypothetical protein
MAMVRAGLSSGCSVSAAVNSASISSSSRRFSRISSVTESIRIFSSSPTALIAAFWRSSATEEADASLATGMKRRSAQHLRPIADERCDTAKVTTIVVRWDGEKDVSRSGTQQPLSLRALHPPHAESLDGQLSAMILRLGSLQKPLAEWWRA